MSQTVERALRIIEFVADRPRTLGEVAGHLEVHKSTALRLLQTLERGGFTRLDEGRYVVGFRLVAIGHRAVERLDLRAVARPHLAGLSERHGHTVHLAQLIGGEIVYIDKLDGQGSVRMESRVGRPARPNTAAVAKAVLAEVAEPVRSRILATAAYDRHTRTTLTSPAALRRELDRCHARGWAEDDGEFEEYLACVAVAVRDAGGAAVAAVSLTALQAVAPLPRLRDCVPDLAAACAAISRDLGWLEP